MNGANPVLDSVRKEPARGWTFLRSSTGGNISRYPDASMSDLDKARKILKRIERIFGEDYWFNG